MSATISTSKSTAERVGPARYTCDILEYLWNQCRQLTALKKVKTEAIELSNILEDDMPRMQTMTRMFGLELELADCTTWWRWQGTLISSSLKTNYLKLSSKDEKREKISKNCVLVFGKVKQNSDGEVRILLGKWSNLLGRWSNLLGRWSNLLGKWSKFDGEMKQNDGQMKQNLMGRCPIDKVK